MCGIIGYIGNKNSTPILIEGLRRLAYRGYDSAGVATLHNHQLFLRREHGKLENLEKLLKESPIEGEIGIGHTRWATHGKPSESNAHPHCWGKIALVHNGIIENYIQLREELIARGHQFASETDTEIVAHLLGEKIEDGDDLLSATRKTIAQIQGAYAIVAISSTEPDAIAFARQQSPLLLALGNDEMLAASDIAAVLEHSRNIIFLDDGDYGIIKKDHIDIYDANNQPVKREPRIISWDIKCAEKRGYKHYMLKEIYEQPEKLVDTFRGRILSNEATINLDESLLKLGLENSRRIQIVACGTSYHAGLFGKYIIEKYARIPVDVEVASEYRYRSPIIASEDTFLAISQSGETADTLACLKLAKSEGARIISICNVMDASIPRLSDATLYTRADPEIGVCSTKAFTTQLASLIMLAIWLARKKGTISVDDSGKYLDALRKIPQQMEKMLENASHVREVAQSLLRANAFLFLGRGVHYPIALEGALKLKEISYLPSEAYPSGEMKHGPIALIDEKLPVIVIAPQNSTYEKTISNLQEVKARGGRIISVLTEGDTALQNISDYCFEMPQTEEITQPLLSILPLQLLAYHLSDLLGNDVDQPRNLAKSVTVE